MMWTSVEVNWLGDVMGHDRFPIGRTKATISETVPAAVDDSYAVPVLYLILRF